MRSGREQEREATPLRKPLAKANGRIDVASEEFE
jgi:hypothetical protein